MRICKICNERPHMSNDRCHRCDTYWRRTGNERPKVKIVRTHCVNGHLLSGRRQCKECHAEYERKRKSLLSQEEKKAFRERYRDKTNAHGKARYWREREKYLCRAKLRGEVRAGRIVKPKLCTKCGSSRYRIEAHHHDYYKPLEVRWLCQSCHRNEHNQVRWSKGGPS